MVVVTVPFDHLREQKWEELEIGDLKRVFREAFGDRLNALGLAVRLSFVLQPMSVHGDKWFISMTFVDESSSKSALISLARFVFIGPGGIEEWIEWMPATPAGILGAEPSSVMVFTYAKLARISANLISLVVDFREENTVRGVKMVGSNRRGQPVYPIVR